MKEHMKNLDIFILLARYSLKTTFQGKVGVLFFLAGKAIRVIFIFTFIVLLFSRTRLIKGYTFDQVILFYLTYNILDTLSQILYREVYRFRPLVLTGGLDMVLLKPFHPFIRVLLGGIDFLDVVLIVPFISIALSVYLRSGNPHPANMLIYLLFIFNSMILITAFHILVLALGIVTTEVDHTIMIYRDITAVGRFPMDIYQEPVRGFFTFIIPVGVMMGTPTQALLGILTVKSALTAFLVSLGGLYLSLLLWKFALKRYQSWGS
jgi:ABC-2 type transport system permease protein